MISELSSKVMSRMSWRSVGSDAVALLDPATEPLLAESARALAEEFDQGPGQAVILLPRQEAPEIEARDDGPVRSFLCAGSVLRDLRSLHPEAQPEALCFLLLKEIINGALNVGRVVVRQLPYRGRQGPAHPNGGPAALLMAHRGDADHLRAALKFLAAADDEDMRVRVGLDLDDTPAYRAVAASHPGVEFFQVKPTPAGPYLIRQALADRAQEPLLVFHDSDDISCSDRFCCLRTELAAGNCDLAGSHELRVDEISRRVHAFRFPLDVTRALHTGPAHALLHATSMVRRAGFAAAGGFSTNQPISGDTQFLLRAYFHIRIRNVDQFLYIRRRHARALTMNPATALGSDLRRQIERPWRDDFEAVKSGRLALEQSTLQPRRAESAHEFIPLDYA